MDLVEEVVPLADRELAVLRPRNSEALLDEHAFEQDEFMPYWAELWPSGVALARAIAPRAEGRDRARARLRARAAEPRGGAGRRPCPGRRLVPRGDRPPAPQRGAQ